jgi:hypothetical protein
MNVNTKVNSEGGKIQYGWALWQPSRFFLEGEHHAVYEPPSGPPWVDVTPHTPTVSRILFLPDETATYDISSDQRRDNVRMPLLSDARITEFCQLCTEYNDILNSVPGLGTVRVTGIKALRLVAIEERKAILMGELERAHPVPKIGRNDPCPCDSGKKYKKCHGA